MVFLHALPGAAAEGLIWALMAIGVYISYIILDMADLTVDGSLCTGGCVCIVLLSRGLNPWLCVACAFLAGALTGVMTGVFHTAFGIPAILSGILSQLILYSVNLAILGGRSLIAIDARSMDLLLHVSDNPGAVLTGACVVAAVILGLWLFFYTEIGLTLKSAGDNPDMSRAQGINVERNRVIGLALSNGLVALSGALLSQYRGAATINDGRGAIVIGLAAIFIGLPVALAVKDNFVTSLIGVTGGSIIYYAIYNFVILMGLKTDYLKMLSALIVVVFLAVPNLRARLKARSRYLHSKQEAEGKSHA